MTDRPTYCCGACPPVEPNPNHPDCDACITGFDCTCRDNPRCPNYQEPPMTDHRLTAERALKEITAALDTLATTITSALDNLAAVGAPDPALADEIRGLVDFTMSGDNCTSDCHERADDIAFRVEQMEQDAQDRQEWNRNLAKQVATLTRERDDARAELEKERDFGVALAHERDDARAEANRLTAERDTKAPRNHDWLAGMKDATRYAVNATPTPADVQPGEAWLVEVNRETRTAVKDTDAAIPWNTVNPSGVFHAEYNEDVTLLTRLVPAPRTITHPYDLDRAKRDTIIRDARGVVCSLDSAGTAWTTFTNLADQRHHIVLPATVLWEPGA